MKNHSEYGLIKSICLKTPENAFISDKVLGEQWENHNYTAKPDFHKSVTEYREFEKQFKKLDCKIHHLPVEQSVTIDSIYCRDASISTNAGMIICNMGKDQRKLEPQAEYRFFRDYSIPVLGKIEKPGTVEGGDVAWINANLLAVGHSYRTNQEGIDQLKGMLQPLGVEVFVADLPHYRGPSDVFHLMSILSPVDNDLAVVYSPLMPIRLRNLLLDLGYRLVEVPEEEFDSMGCNVLALSPRNCLMVAGNPITKSRLVDAGAEVIEYDGNEISVKGGGGPTCLTRPIERV